MTLKNRLRSMSKTMVARFGKMAKIERWVRAGMGFAMTTVARWQQGAVYRQDKDSKA